MSNQSTKVEQLGGAPQDSRILVKIHKTQNLQNDYSRPQKDDNFNTYVQLHNLNYAVEKITVYHTEGGPMPNEVELFALAKEKDTGKHLVVRLSDRSIDGELWIPRAIYGAVQDETMKAVATELAPESGDIYKNFADDLSRKCIDLSRGATVFLKFDGLVSGDLLRKLAIDVVAYNVRHVSADGQTSSWALPE